MQLISFHFDCGRNGDLHGLFAVLSEDALQRWNYILESQRDVYFGEEVLGKHSEIYGPVEECDYVLVTDDPERINMVLTGIYGSAPTEGWVTISGWNPLDYFYIECDDCYDDGCPACEGEE